MNKKSLLDKVCEKLNIGLHKVCEKLDIGLHYAVDGFGRLVGGIANLEPLSFGQSVGACFLAVFVWIFAISINFWA